MKNYRLYTFVNFYLSGIQKGIQTAHVVSELFYRYRSRADAFVDAETEVLYDWATNYKTIIVLDGGNSQQLIDLHRFIFAWQSCEFKHAGAEKYLLPFRRFYEDEASLNGALTCVGVVLPDDIYDVTFTKFGTQGDKALYRVAGPQGYITEIEDREEPSLEVLDTLSPLDARLAFIRKLKTYRLASN